jgi:hypothetical protein
MHVNYHVNIGFHVDKGEILGATIYPGASARGSDANSSKSASSYRPLPSSLLLSLSLSRAVRDRFQVVQPGATVNFHGPVRFFARHSFKLLSEGDSAPRQPLVDAPTVQILSWCLLTLLLSALGFVALYSLVLRPALVKRFLKHD